MTKILGWAEAVALLLAALVTNAPARAQSAPPQGSFVEVDGARLYYEECGSAPHTVVLVHDGVLRFAFRKRGTMSGRTSACTFTPSGTIGEGTDDLR